MMTASKKIISSLSVAAVTFGAASPALAYIPQSKMYIESAEQAQDGQHARVRTSRSIRGNRNQNSLKGRVGTIRIRGGERSSATADRSGRARLRVRSTWRHPFLRNQNRHKLGHRRNGWSNTLRRQKNTSASGPILYRLPEKSRARKLRQYESSLPPVLVQTGTPSSLEKHPNWRRNARGYERSSRVRDLNGLNRR